MVQEKIADEGADWQHCFDRLCDANCEKSCHVEILPLDLSLEGSEDASTKSYEQDEILTAYQPVQNPNSDRRLFAYARRSRHAFRL